MAGIAERAERWLRCQGVAGGEEVDEDDAQQVIMAASIQGKQAVGPRAGAPVKRVQILGGREFALPPRCASCDGYNLHAGVAIKASDRDGLERICRYVARPPSRSGPGPSLRGRATEAEPGLARFALAALAPPPSRRLRRPARQGAHRLAPRRARRDRHEAHLQRRDPGPSLLTGRIRREARCSRASPTCQPDSLPRRSRSPRRVAEGGGTQATTRTQGAPEALARQGKPALAGVVGAPLEGVHPAHGLPPAQRICPP